MTTLQISLPEQLKKFIQKETKQQGCSTLSEYMQKLVIAEKKRQGRAKVEALVLEGLNSGPATPMTRQDWDDIRREGLAQLQKRKH